MILKTLYKRTVNGKIAEWTIETEDNCYRTISGYTDGVKTTSEWTCCEAKNVGKKNETTAKEQAINEAVAMHRKRIELGSFEDIYDVDKPVHFKPMLANDYEDYKGKITFPIYSQPKLDGVRCIVRADGMWSRNGKPIISAPHIFESLKPLFEKDPHLVLDGELYADKLANDFNKIISLVRKSKPTKIDLIESRAEIEYHIYDLPSHTGTFTQRWRELSTLITDNIYCKLVSTNQIDNMNDLSAYYFDYMNAGYEGQMLRLDAQYENKRSKSLLKHKSFQDGEFEILGVLEGKGNLTGKVGKLMFEINGKPFESAVNGDWEYIERLWNSKEGLIGKMATVKYFELTEDGLPRFPKVIAIRDFE
jgi:DNA ligase-1